MKKVVFQLLCGVLAVFAQTPVTVVRTETKEEQEDAKPGYIAGIVFFGVLAVLLLIGIVFLSLSNSRLKAKMDSAAESTEMPTKETEEEEEEEEDDENDEGEDASEEVEDKN